MAGLGQCDQRVRIASLENRTHVDVRDPARAVEELAAAEALPEQQDTLPVQVADVDGQPSRQRMPARRNGEDAQREQGAAVELIGAPSNRQRQLDLATLDEVQCTKTALLEQMDVEGGPRPQVSCEERGQHALDHLRRGSDAEAPGIAAAYARGVFDQLVDASQEVAAPQPEAVAGAREPDVTPGTLEEPHAQLRLEIVDLPPERRLRDAQAGGGPGEGTGLGDGDEVAEVTELHLVDAWRV